MAKVAKTKRRRPQKRPGGRTAEVTRRINDAVIQLLTEGGLDACTFQQVADRAGIERSTLYRRSPERWPIIVDAIIDHGERLVSVADTGTFRGDLKETLIRLREAIHSPLGPAVFSVAVALRQGVAPGETERFWATRRQQLSPMFDNAIARGELPADIDSEKIYAIAAGPLFHFAFVMGQRADDSMIDDLVDMVGKRYAVD